MRKLTAVRIVAVLALAGSAVTGAVVATAGSAGAKTKPPVVATCGVISGTTTIAIEVSGSAASVVQGCSGGKATNYGTDVSTLSNASPTDGAGNATIYWSNNKTTTYSYTVTAPTTTFTCPEWFGQADTGQETLTVSNIGGNAKLTGGGTFNVCYYLNGSDIYETSVGAVTF